MVMEGIVILARFAVTGPGHLAVNESTMKSILKSNVRTFIRQLKFWQNWVTQQDNDPKHS